MLYILLVLFLASYVLSQTPLIPVAIAIFNFVVDRILIPLVKPAIITALLGFLGRFLFNKKLNCLGKQFRGLDSVVRAYRAGAEEFDRCIKEKKRTASRAVEKKIVTDETTNTSSECSCDTSVESEYPQVKRRPQAKGKNSGPAVVSMGASGVTVKPASLQEALSGTNLSVAAECKDCK
jgi:hypothetical protein